MTPNQPAITPAQIAAAIVALIAPVAEALHAFGVYDLTLAQQHALTTVAYALAGFAAVLVAADAALRAARNKARATIAAGSPAPLPVQFGNVAGSGNTISSFELTATDEESGDELDPIFDGLESDPASVPKDKGESKGLALIQRAPLGTPAISRLTASQRAKVRQMILQAAYLGLTRAPSLHYTQGAKRWEGIAKNLRAWRGECPNYADCSAFATWVLWQGLWHFGVGDVVNGASWAAGWTGTMLDHGKVVHSAGGYLVGDCALYDGHVAIFVGYKAGVPYVISHGSENGPYLLPMHYRSDLIEVRRYV